MRTTPAGSKAVNIFVLARSADGATEFGWTSANNLAQRFLSETISAIEPMAATNQFGPNAAWSNGKFLKQITLSTGHRQCAGKRLAVPGAGGWAGPGAPSVAAL